jgi:hypothetical protein
MTGSDRDREAKGGETFLSRWSERKRAAREGEVAEDTERAKQAKPAEAEADPEELAANRAAAEAIDLDTIGPGFDLSPFHKAGVPAALKMAALQKYWRSHPVISAQDLLCDYIEDFNDPTRTMRTPLTSWKPGRGYLTGKKADAAKPEIAESQPSVEPRDEPRSEAAAPKEAPEHAHAQEGQPVAEAGEFPPEEEPTPRVPLRARLDLSAFKDKG